jgi:hypothetical protein
MSISPKEYEARPDQYIPGQLLSSDTDDGSGTGRLLEKSTESDSNASYSSVKTESTTASNFVTRLFRTIFPK